MLNIFRYFATILAISLLFTACSQKKIVEKPTIFEEKQDIIEKLSEHDDTAEYVTDSKGKPKADSNLRDTEKIPLVQNIDDYFRETINKRLLPDLHKYKFHLSVSMI